MAETGVLAQVLAEVREVAQLQTKPGAVQHRSQLALAADMEMQVVSVHQIQQTVTNTQELLVVVAQVAPALTA